MNFLFLMDPLETVTMETDTSFILMLESFKRGHDVYYVPEDGITLIEGKVYFHATKVKPQAILHEPFITQQPVRISQDEVHMVFVRPNPPFDELYLMNSWLLDHLPKRIPVINTPSGIRSVNEKVWAAQFTDLTPPTLISNSKHDMLQFIDKHKSIIAKPTNQFGGQGVFHIEAGHTNTNVILETVSKGYNEAIILQKYIPEAQLGDKRILLLNGEFLGAVLRVHAQGEHRNNFYSGGTAQAATLTKRDEHIINVLKPHLLKLGLYFVGIDILGEYLIEVNVTSPTCLQEMNRLYNVNLEEKALDFFEQLVA